MMKPFFGKRPRLPSFHPGRRDGDPINSASAICHIPADLPKTVAPKKLASARHVILPLEAVPGRVITGIFGERCSGNTKSWILGKLPHQEFQVIGIKGK